MQSSGRSNKDWLLNIYKLTEIRETVSQPLKQNKNLKQTPHLPFKTKTKTKHNQQNNPETNTSPTDFQSQSLQFHLTSVWDCLNVFLVSCSQAET